MEVVEEVLGVERDVLVVVIEEEVLRDEEVV